ncbi:clh-3, partial [Symbiodinium sp. KB8]
MAAAAIQRRASAMLSQLSSVKDVSAHSVVSGGGVSILDVYGGVSVAESDSGEAATSHASIPLVAHQGAGDWHRQQAQRGYCSRLCALCRRQLLSLLAAPSSWLFLVTLGVAAAGMGSAFDAASRALLGARLGASTPPSAQGAAIWSLWTVAFAAVALACVFLGSRRAEGSGVPQLKSLLAGTDLSSFLDLSVALPKALGSLAAHASGLSVGKEGPFVHLTALFARHLWRLPGFAPIRNSPGLQRQMLGAAVAAGVTAVFGTPVGGVLFSIEVTATYYQDPATDEVAPAQWGDMPPAYASALFLAVRSITTVAALSLPIPCGLFTPVFALGAALGRLFGELAATVAPNAGVDPAMFAVAGAAALASGATHTLSTAVMVFELTRQIHHFLPVLVAVLVAYSVSSLFTLGVYDLLLQLAGLPFLPRALPHSMYHRQARDLVPPTGRLCMVADSDLAACREVLGRLNASSRPRAGSLSHYTPLPPQETSLTSPPDAGGGPTSRALPWLQWVRDAVGGVAPDMAAPAAPVPVIRSASGAQLLGTVSRVSLAATLAAAAEEGAAENTRVVFLARGEVAPPGAVGVALDTAPFI